MITWFAPVCPLLGLTHSPGSRFLSRDEELRGFLAAGVRHVISLQQEHELQLFGGNETAADRRDAVIGLGMRYTNVPIRDQAAPTFSQTWQIIKLIRAEIQQQQRVALHCQAGLGRAGTVSACFLVAGGSTSEDAMLFVRWVRQGAIQSREQEMFILNFEQWRDSDCTQPEEMA
ncbi:MAG: dual specificity protein phosphatase family protein [Desulfuromonadales bacterium]|nr:dual specificity protein phosphatase family protein [Desulfuromonadales bacterium]